MPTGGDVLIDGLRRYGLSHVLPARRLKLTSRRALKYGKCSDCKIVCGSYEVNVHEVVLNSHSPYFEVCLNKETFKVR